MLGIDLGAGNTVVNKTDEKANKTAVFLGLGGCGDGGQQGRWIKKDAVASCLIAPTARVQPHPSACYLCDLAQVLQSLCAAFPSFCFL